MKTIYKFILCVAAMVVAIFCICCGTYLVSKGLAADTMVLLTAIYLFLDGIGTFIVACAYAYIFLFKYTKELSNETDND